MVLLWYYNSLWYYYGIIMVILWYYNGIIIGGRALLRGIFNEGKNIEIYGEKLFFSQIFGVVRYFAYFCSRISNK